MSAFVLHDVSHASPTINVEFSDDGGTFVLGRAHVPRKNCHVSRAQAHLRANSGYILDPSSSLLIGTSSLILESCGLHSTGVLSGTDVPSAARRVIDVLLGEEFQTGIPLSMYVEPARDDVELPEVFVKFAERPDDVAELDPATITENRERWIAEWTELVLG